MCTEARIFREMKIPFLQIGIFCFSITCAHWCYTDARRLLRDEDALVFRESADTGQ